MNTAPDFELTMQEKPRMNERLTRLSDLVGETILAVFDNYSTKSDNQIVLVTDTLNWIVLSAESDNCGEDPTIEVAPHWASTEPSLSDFVPARELLDAGCINAEVFNVLKAKEDAKTAAMNEARAQRLRAELERLSAAPKGAA